MEIIMWLFIGAILIFLIYIAVRKPLFLATGKVEACAGKVLTSVEGITEMTAVPMVLCYLAKIHWLTLSEEEITQQTFRKVLALSMQNWPEIPYVEMLASLSQTSSIYRVKLHKSRRVKFNPIWFVINHTPHLAYGGDLVTHYFFLLRKIVEVLPENGRNKVGQALHAFSEILFMPESNQESLDGLKFLNREANRIIELVQ